jgi:hypothetical protein
LFAEYDPEIVANALHNAMIENGFYSKWGMVQDSPNPGAPIRNTSDGDHCLEAFMASVSF